MKMIGEYKISYSICMVKLNSPIYKFSTRPFFLLNLRETVFREGLLIDGQREMVLMKIKAPSSHTNIPPFVLAKSLFFRVKYFL